MNVPNIHNPNAILYDQIAYYQARAKEYDQWFYRQGRYNRGAELNQRWFEEIEEVRQSLDAFKPSGQVLELACGTGLWAELLVRRGRVRPETSNHPRARRTHETDAKPIEARSNDSERCAWELVERLSGTLRTRILGRKLFLLQASGNFAYLKASDQIGDRNKG